MLKTRWTFAQQQYEIFGTEKGKKNKNKPNCPAGIERGRETEGKFGENLFFTSLQTVQICLLVSSSIPLTLWKFGGHLSSFAHTFIML